MTTAKIIIFIVIAVALVAGGVFYNKKFDENVAKRIEQQENVARDQEAKDRARIRIQEIRVGSGAEAKKGDAISVHYLGEFLDGKKFDSSYDRGQTFEMTLGVGNVIRGWDLGVQGMKVGGKRILVIPPDLAYGASGSGPIPPSSTLKFTIELFSVNVATSTRQ